MIRRPPRSTLSSSSAASDVYKRQIVIKSLFEEQIHIEAEKVIKNNTEGVSTFSHAPDTIFSKRIYDYDEAYSYIYDFAKRNTLGKYLYFLDEAKKSVDIPVIASIN